MKAQPGAVHHIEHIEHIEHTEENDVNTNGTDLAARAHYLIQDRIHSAPHVLPTERRRHRAFRRLGWL